MEHGKKDPLMTLINPVSGSITDQLYEKLRSLIITGELPPGYVFPIETEFCEQLNVGRSTLREVYKALATAGYITRSKTGTYVNDRTSIICATPLNITIEHTDIEEVLVFRKMLEAESAYYAAMNATPEELARIKEAIDIQPYIDKDLQALVKNDVKFHQRIAEAAHNKLLLQSMMHMLGSIEQACLVAFAKTIKEGGQMLFYSLHQEIFLAIEARKPEEAALAMRNHMVTTRTMLREENG